MIWLTSDTHAYHHNIIKYCNRPFSNADVMSETLADNINRRVLAQDTLIHLGDFAFGRDSVRKFRSMINCQNVIFVFGNHDKKIRRDVSLQRLFTKCHELYEFKAPFHYKEGCSSTIVCCHYAMRIWHKSHHGACHAYGHSHASLEDKPNSRSIDVGVDTELYGHERFTPYSLEEFYDIMKQKTFESIDHHIHGENCE